MKIIIMSLPSPGCRGGGDEEDGEDEGEEEEVLPRAAGTGPGS